MRTAAADAAAFIPVGEICGVFGVRGWLKVRSFTRPPEGLLAYRRWHLLRDGAADNYFMIAHRVDGGNLVVKLRSVNSREAADQLVGATVAILEAELPSPPTDQYYWRDLVGLVVINREGEHLGTVTGLLETGANDVLVVEGSRQRLIPFVPEHYVDRVDPPGGRILVDWHLDD